MNFESNEMHATVREGYQILLRAEARLRLPIDKPVIRAFYERLANTCMRWATEVHGEMLRREFSALEGVRERSQFGTQHYRLRMGFPWSEERYLAVICESRLDGQWHEPQKSYHRISHVWDTEEESILPIPQILRLFGFTAGRGVQPFRPDGVYPEEDRMVFFRNASDTDPFREKKLSRMISPSEPQKKEKNT